LEHVFQFQDNIIITLKRIKFGGWPPFRNTYILCILICMYVCMYHSRELHNFNVHVIWYAKVYSCRLSLCVAKVVGWKPLQHKNQWSQDIQTWRRDGRLQGQRTWVKSCGRYWIVSCGRSLSSSFPV